VEKGDDELWKNFSFLLIQNEGKRLKNQYTKRQKTKLQKHAFYSQDLSKMSTSIKTFLFSN